MKTPLPEARGARVLTDWVTATLRLAILKGHFAPGEKIDQDLIAEELDVSRTPIRESLKVLDSEGFVEIRPHRGAFITEVTGEDVRKIYEARALIEAEIVRRVTPRIPDSVLDDMKQCFDRMNEMSEDRERHVESDIRFHDVLAEYVDNELFQEILEGLNNRILRVRRFAQLQPGYHLRESHEEHCAIMEAIRRRDADRAAELMARHLRKSAERICRSMSEQWREYGPQE
jgi:DNA-binding GntR family transcriptional regulator